MIFSRFLGVALFLLALFAPLAGQADERIKPFVLAAQSPELPAAVLATTQAKLEAAGYRVIGDYAPYADAQVLVFTSDALIATARRSELGAFGAVLRAAATRVGDQTQLSYVNPIYLAQAYRLDATLEDVAAQLAETLGAEQSFGSKKGLKAKSLRKYHYMMGMEYFDDPYELGEFDSQDAAVAAVSANLASNTIGLSEVYRLELPEQGAVLFGVAMAPAGEDNQYFNDAFQMSVVDVGELRSTAYLPYEVLVKDGEVIAQHMRFRMAVHFPDLSMMGKHSFMTLMPSPDAIEEALQTLASP